MIITGEFDAPRGLAFKAFTDAGLYAQWIGPRGLSTRIEMFEAWDGGRWKYTQKDKDGNEFRFHGNFREVSPPERIIGPSSMISSRKGGTSPWARR